MMYKEKFGEKHGRAVFIIKLLILFATLGFLAHGFILSSQIIVNTNAIRLSNSEVFCPIVNKTKSNMAVEVNKEQYVLKPNSMRLIFKVSEEDTVLRVNLNNKKNVNINIEDVNEMDKGIKNEQ